jgi:SAM-dependent methyltransferase
MQNPSFKDHFSGLATTYARHRPRYPDALFAYLAEIAESRTCAWDCATGNGQAAQNLAQYFDLVYATDASAAQIQAAEAFPRVEYSVAPAEASGLQTASADVCTVAQAVHWFDFEKFFTEVRRVLKPRGILALWTYTESNITSEIDLVMREFYHEIRPYFPKERQWVDERYATLPFPFEEISTPQFVMEAAWNLDDVLGYYRSWSGVKEYEKQHGSSPLTVVQSRLQAIWGKPEEVREVRWNLYVRLGRMSA